LAIDEGNGSSCVLPCWAVLLFLMAGLADATTDSFPKFLGAVAEAQAWASRTFDAPYAASARPALPDLVLPGRAT
jgi:hypothetical protein